MILRNDPFYRPLLQATPFTGPAPERELELLIGLPLAAYVVVAKSIAHRQWLTTHIIAEHEPSLEVERPHFIGTRRLCHVL